jgi:hypothetical protein
MAICAPGGIVYGRSFDLLYVSELVLAAGLVVWSRSRGP